MTLAPKSVPGPRPRYRPPIGIPVPRQNGAGSVVTSVLVHALIIFLLIGPVLMRDVLVPENKGAGGKGPVGGGGGGNRGPLRSEKTNFLQIAAPPPPPVQKQPQPQVVPPPVVPPPEPERPTPVPQVVLVREPTTTVVGAGGTGNDGSKGSGPGSGGGIGSGDGTGRGSGNGPGTGGGSGRIYPPTVTNLALLPLPVPAKVRPYTLVAVFEVDEKGNAKLLHFNESKDAGYNKKIRAMLEEFRFRPAVRADGTPVRDTVSVVSNAPL